VLHTNGGANGFESFNGRLRDEYLTVKGTCAALVLQSTEAALNHNVVEGVS
jgi:hypothetical protein